MKRKPEILAPAGSIQGMKAAIAAGCDAVYMGGKHFGARAFADNPKEDELLAAIDYCHLHGVKLYMTVNTLLKNREMEAALFSFLRPYYEAGLDAVIVQDVGVLHFVAEHFPGLDIHASTQMTLTMGKGAKELEKYHVTRIVPSRELTLTELSQMRKDTGLELEVFVHGALCYCYSGQCLFSSMLGGRSGNRGRCAQPCRMPYRFADGRGMAGEYLLSPKELCNLPYLPELIDIGIDSFKIEGRMKRPEYTAFVTAVYRKYVDLYLELGREAYLGYLKEHGEEWQEDLRCLAELYNRNGFTQGYLEGLAGELSSRRFHQKGEMLAGQRPKHGGVLVGKVLSVGAYEVIYQTTKKLSGQDVVEFRDKRQQPSYEYTIGQDIAAGERVTARYQKGSRIKAGDLVYRTKDAALLMRIRENYLEKEQQLPVSAVFTATVNESSRLVVSWQGKEYTEAAGQKEAAYSQNCRRKEPENMEIIVECMGEPCQEAVKQPAEEEAVRRTLNQTGNSPFYFQHLLIKLDGRLFLPVGALKKLRRQALEELERRILERYHRLDTIEYKKSPLTNRQKDTTVEKTFSEIRAEVMRQEQLEPVLLRKEITVIYLHMEVLTAEELKKCFQRILLSGKRPWLVLPGVVRKSVWDILSRELSDRQGIFSLSWEGYLVKNMESLSFLLQEAGVAKDAIRLDYNMYVMNQEACTFWKEQGITRFTMPLELTGEEMKELSFQQQSELVVYGKPPLMISAQCLQANTEGCAGSHEEGRNQALVFYNQKGQAFEAVNYCKYCYNIIYQSQPLAIRELVKKQKELSFEGLRYSFTTENQEEVIQVLDGSLIKGTQTGHFRLGIE